MKSIRKIKKFMFVVPNTRWFGKRCWLWFVPGVTILSQMLKKNGYDVKICEANIDNLSSEEVKEKIKLYSPDVVGISNMSIEYWKQLHLCAELAKDVDKNIIVIAGGVHPITLPEKVMEDNNVDYVVLSEGEERLFQLLDIIQSDYDFTRMNGVLFRENDEVKKIPSKGWYKDLNNVQIPDYKSLYDNPEIVFSNTQISAGGVSTRRTPVANILSSRGCPYRCTFCSVPVTTGNKMRFRTPENVLDEIDMLVNEWGVREIVFHDDEMYASVKRARQIVQLIKDRKYKDLIWKNSNIASWRLDRDLVKLMAESGCYQITISAESGNARVLKEIIHKPGNTLESTVNVIKWCKEFGIETHVDFVIGFPDETWDEIRDTTNFAERLDADSIKFAVATPFPKTELLKIAVEKGMFPENYDWYTNDYLGFANPTMDSEHWTANDLKMMRVLEWDRINFKNEEKKKRYAKIEEMTLDEVEDFRKETRNNLGVYFVDDQAESRESSLDNKSGGDIKKWERIQQINAKIAKDALKYNHGHEII